MKNLLLMFLLLVVLMSIVYANICISMNCEVNCSKAGGAKTICVAAKCCKSKWFI